MKRADCSGNPETFYGSGECLAQAFGDQVQFIRPDCPHIKEETIILDSADNRDIQFTQFFFKVIDFHRQGSENNGFAGEILLRHGSAPDPGHNLRNLNGAACADTLFQNFRKLFSLVLNYFYGRGDHVQSRYTFKDRLRLLIESESRFQGGQGEFINTQGPVQGVFFNVLDNISAAEDDSGLRAAEQLVAAEGDHVHAGCHRLLHCGFFFEAVGAQVG